MHPPLPAQLLIIDANVLIDYALADRSVLTLVVHHIGPLHVPVPILAEVEQLTEADCRRLGLTLLEPEAADLMTAASQRGSLSFEDHLCLLMAQRGGFTCVTNDKALRRECESGGVSILWGLQLMVELVTRQELSAEAALSTAAAIRRDNPRHITVDILDRFTKTVQAVTRRPRGKQL
ncbi:MAG: hypothetical protein DIJKHBIC_02311 [Thermoanaerobaculia bacterium]|nr:hypothetical protein [Thermoanaerobaculia bacterium]